MVERYHDSVETQRLLELIAAGDRGAFNDLFNRHRDALRRAVQLRLDRRLRARVDESDVVQEAQMEAFRRLEDYLARRPMPFALWLRKTAQDRIANHRRDHLHAGRRSVEREVALPENSSLMIAAPLTSGASPARGMMKREFRLLVGEAVAKLDELDREILLMRNVEGLTQRQIGQVLELSYDAVRQRYGRALIKLKRLLSAGGITGSEP